MIIIRLFTIFICGSPIFLHSFDIYAQVVPQIPDIKPSNEIELKDPPKLKPDIDIQIHKIPIERQFSPIKLYVGQIRFEGNTQLSDDEIRAVTKKYENRAVTNTEIRELERSIAALYANAGYVTTLALFDEELNTLRNPKTEGLLLTIIESQIHEINLTGVKSLNAFVLQRINKGDNKVFNKFELEEAIRFLLLDPRIKDISARVIPSPFVSKSILLLEVTPEKLARVNLSYDNDRSPSVGTQQRRLWLAHLNALGIADTFILSFSNTDGSNALQARYQIPVNSNDASLALDYAFVVSSIVESPFDQLDISGRSELFQISFRQPIFRKATASLIREFALGISFSHENSSLTSPLIPFPLTRGAEPDGETRISAIRLRQEFVQRQKSSLLQAESELSIGLDLGGTNNAESPDTEFVAWRAKGKWTRDLSSILQFNISADLQISDRPLLSSEQFAIGGRSTLRGVRKNSSLSDNGVLASVELAIKAYDGLLGQFSVAPFVDFGAIWNNDMSILPLTRTLSTFGLGLHYQYKKCSASIYYGIPTNNRPDMARTLQENGVQFSLSCGFSF